MNKKIYLCAVAALALASCSNDETVEVAKQSAISFRSVVGLNTRAVETTTGNLDAINVTAYKGTEAYFGVADPIKYEKNGNFFESAQKYYWPVDDAELTFIALSTNWTGTRAFTSSSDIKMTDVTIDKNVKNQADMIYVSGATGKKSVNEASGLGLVMDHALSQIQINAKNGNDLYKYQVKGIRIAKVNKKATFDVIDGTWNNASEVETYDVNYDTPITLQADAQPLMEKNATNNNLYENAMLIPQTTTAWDGIAIDDAVTGSYISVYLQITTKDGGLVYPKKADGFAWASVPVSFTWVRGNKYIYTLDFTNGAGKVDPVDPGTDWKKDEPQKDPDKGQDILGEPIKFTVTVNPWTPEDKNQEM